MQIFNKKTDFNFMGKTRFFVTLSIVAVVVSVLLAVVIQPKFGIDFVGGTEIQIKFSDDQASVANIRSVLKQLKFDGAEVVSFGEGKTEYLVRLKKVTTIDEKQVDDYRKSIESAVGDVEVVKFDFSPGGDKLTLNLDSKLDISAVEKAVVDAGLTLSSQKASSKDVEEAGDETKTARKCESSTCTLPYKNQQIYEVALAGVTDQVMDAMRAQSWGKDAKRMRSVWVGAKVGKQLRDAGISSISFAILFIMIYIALRFDLRYAPGAAVALIHDILITLGILVIARVEVTLATVAALLTIVGYSLNDTIVVFDRIRENMDITRESKLVTVINNSLNQTLSRTILTSVTTLIAVVILLVFGWKTSLRDFSFALVVGVMVGTYSSIYVASPVLVFVDRLFSQKKA